MFPVLKMLKKIILNVYIVQWFVIKYPNIRVKEKITKWTVVQKLKIFLSWFIYYSYR